MTTALAAFAVVFVAEFGDRTQLLIASLAARHAVAPVLGGLALGYAITNVLAVVVGSAIGAAMSERTVGVVGGLAFLGFAAWTWWGDADEDDDGEPDVDSRHPVGVMLSISGAIIVSEFGDRSQLATATLAADGHPVQVWVGATLAIVTAGAIGLAAGRLLARRIPPEVLRRGSALLFAVFGATLLTRALL